MTEVYQGFLQQGFEIGLQLGKAEGRRVVREMGDCFEELVRIADILRDSNKSNALAIDALLNINRRWQAELKEWGIE